MKSIRYRHWLIARLSGTGLAVAGVLGCVAYGQAAVAIELVKIIGPPLVTGVAGILGGYATGLSKGRRQARDEAEADAG